MAVERRIELNKRIHIFSRKKNIKAERGKRTKEK